MAAAKPKTPAPGPGPLDQTAVQQAGAMAGDAGARIEATDSPVDRAVVGAGRAQALSMAMVDAAGHLRRVETLSLAAIATALEAILAGDTERGSAALAAAEGALDNAVGRLKTLVALSDAEGG